MQHPQSTESAHDVSQESWLALARTEAARMRATVQAAEAGAKIRMTREQFLWLANLLENLGNSPQGCSDPDCFNAQGIRLWVPADHVERELAELARLRDSDRRRGEQIQPRRLAN